MTRILGIHANRVDALRPVLRAVALEGLLPRARGGEAFGFVFYQGDELLHQKRPIPEATPAVLGDMVADDVRTDCALVSLAPASASGFRTLVTGPYRYRRWAFATTGGEAEEPSLGERWLAELPDHLRRGIAGGTVAEALFGAILAELPDSGRIDDPELPAGLLEDAIRRALDRTGMRARTAPRFSAILTNGVRTLGLAAGSPLDYVVRMSVPGTRLGSEKADARITLIVDAALPEPAEGVVRSAERALLVVDRDLGVREAGL